MSVLSSAAREDLGKFRKQFPCVPVKSGDAVGLASMDLGSKPHSLVFVLVRADGEIVAGRRSVKDAAGIKEALQGIEAAGDDGIGFSRALDWFGLRGEDSGYARSFLASFRRRHPESDASDDEVLATAAVNLASSGLGAVEERLDKEALKALSCAGAFPRSAYKFYAAPGDTGLFRRQAAAAYPLLAADFAAKILVKLAIDTKKPLGEALERAYGADEMGTPFLGKALQRRLQGKALRDGGVPMPVIIEALAKIPADWFPRTPQDWDAFLDVADTAFRNLAKEIGEQPETLAAGAAGKWSEFRRRVAKAYALTFPPDGLTEEERKAWRPVVDESRDALKDACIGAEDVVRAFRDLVVVPAASLASNGGDVYLGSGSVRLAQETAARILYGGKSLANVMELSRHWHTQAANIFNAVAEREQAVQRGVIKEVAEDGWAPLCDMWTAPNGVSIVPLTDPRELKDEGAGGLGHPGPDRNGIMGLGHCVGGYSEQCRRQGHHIISYRLYNPDGTFTRLSTAEFGPIRPDSNKLDCRQHRGRQNGTPPEPGREAHEWFMQAVEANEIPVNRDGIMNYLAGIRVKKDDVELMCGYDRKDPELVATALEPWRPYLPKRLRDATLDELRAAPEMAELTEALVPTYSAAIRR